MCSSPACSLGQQSIQQALGLEFRSAPISQSCQSVGAMDSHRRYHQVLLGFVVGGFGELAAWARWQGESDL